MKPTDELRDRLESLTETYADDGQRIPVTFHPIDSEISPSDENDAGAVIQVMNDPEQFYQQGFSEVDQLRLIRNALSHEVEHYNRSDLYAKELFARLYPNAPDLAGYVWNVVEDHYINAKRCNAYPNIRDAHAFRVKLLMDSDELRRPINTIESEPNQLTAGLLQESDAGYTKGVDESVSNPVQTALAEFRILLGEARDEDEQQERTQIAHSIVETIQDLIDDDPEWDHVLDELEKADISVDIDALEDGEKTLQSNCGTDVRPNDRTIINLRTDARDRAMNSPPEARELDGIGDWFNARPTFATPRTYDHKNVYRLHQDEKAPKSELDKRLRDRDDIVSKSKEAYKTAQNYLRERDLDTEVAEAFKELVSVENEEPDRAGPRMDMAGINRHMSGDYSCTDLYRNHETKDFGGMCVGVCLDDSGSMDRTKAQAALLALAIATDITGDDIAINGFGTAYGNGRRLITAPGEQFRPEMLDALTGGAGTSTTAAVDDMIGLLGKSQAREKFMIVITDGGVNSFHGDSGSYASCTEELHKYVSAARTAGIPVLGLGVGSVNQTLMQEQFSTGRGKDLSGPGTLDDGDGWLLAGMDSLADVLVREYEKQALDDSDSVY